MVWGRTVSHSRVMPGHWCCCPSATGRKCSCYSMRVKVTICEEIFTLYSYKSYLVFSIQSTYLTFQGFWWEFNGLYTFIYLSKTTVKHTKWEKQTIGKVLCLLTFFFVLLKIIAVLMPDSHGQRISVKNLIKFSRWNWVFHNWVFELWDVRIF